MTNFEILTREIAECRIRAKSQETIEVLHYLQELAENCLNNNWISVDDYIPIEGETALTWDGFKVSVGEVVSYFNHLDDVVCVAFDDEEVTHWQPSPEPPKEK